jgi:hypothetical protein
MLEILRTLKNETKDFDVLIFLPGKKEDSVEITTAIYDEPAEKIDTGKMGDCYQILLFKKDDEKIIHLDTFDAILTDWLEYASELIPLNWFGVICKKTTKSNKMMESMLAHLGKIC